MIYVVGVLVVALGLYGWHCESIKKTAAQIQAKADEQKRLYKIEVEESRKITNEKEAAHVLEIARITTNYESERKRLLNRTRASGVPTLSSAASSISCPDRQPDIVARLDKLEGGVLTLIERGDKAIVRTILAKDWIEIQRRLRKPQSHERPDSSNIRLSPWMSLPDSVETDSTLQGSLDEYTLLAEES